ncbi:MAG: 7-cyano-7-deazaguanine synthase [Candidatus Bathyarchaeota archaeon]|nr:7-cyano-7-deazaguanine synthase [Candidatus Bathyarchaeota archaeon]
MVREIHNNGETLYICEVYGFGYSKKSWAEKCQDYCSKYKACSLEITGQAVQRKDEKDSRPKALVLFSGGLDSMLAMRLIMNQGIEVEAVHFVTSFSAYNERFVDDFCKESDVKLHKVSLSQEYLDLVVSPRHGYGSQMNPCIDCRILAFKKAKEMAERIGADFIVTGEVLGERPFSQKKDSMFLIEREAGLEGKILRPLSAKLLPESKPEKKGFVNRERFYAIRGRRRLPQIELAKKLGISEYPNPAGGCLLTDPRFAERLREHLKHEKRLTLVDAELLKVGRHFRVDKAKVIVGRNEEENMRLLSTAKEHDLPCMEVIDYVGPVTLLVGEVDRETVKKAAAITARYSDAPRRIVAKVRYVSEEGEQILESRAIEDEELRHSSV